MVPTARTVCGINVQVSSMESVPMEWLKRMRANAKKYNYTVQYLLLDLIIKKWESERDEYYDEFGARILVSGTSDR